MIGWFIIMKKKNYYENINKIISNNDEGIDVEHSIDVKIQTVFE